MSRLGRFDEAGLARVREAVAEAELGSGGELVTYIVGHADDYPEACWMGAAVGAALALGSAQLFVALAPVWGGNPWLWVVVPAVLGLLIGWGAVEWTPFLKRLLAGPRFTSRVAGRAEQAFLEEEVFATASRTGVLVFIALFERKVVVLADEGIHAAVPPEKWEQLAEDVAGKLASGPDVDAVVSGVERVGAFLSEGGVERSADDVNELGDEPRVRKS